MSSTDEYMALHIYNISRNKVFSLLSGYLTYEKKMETPLNEANNSNMARNITFNVSKKMDTVLFQ